MVEKDKSRLSVASASEHSATQAQALTATPSRGEDQQSLSPKVGSRYAPIARAFDSPIVKQTASFGAIVLAIAYYATHTIASYRPYAPTNEFVTTGLVIWSIATLLVAFVSGFIFGIPRVRSADATTSRDPIQANTNLESISDWLTKILVGVGLTQLQQLPAAFRKLSEFVAKSFNVVGVPIDNLVSISGASLLLFGSLGFIFGYIFARVYLAHLFRLSDSDGRDANAPVDGRATSGARPDQFRVTDTSGDHNGSLAPHGEHSISPVLEQASVEKPASVATSKQP